jgi:glycosyltransferase involved in cell wall biosynthesis
MRVVVTVCTRARPQVFAACLNSLVKQELPPDVSFALVVVENDDHPNSREMVEALAKTCNSPKITYAHEPQIGIPIARNRALVHALADDPDWIGFIDDDEVADRKWLASFMQTARSVPCDAFQGPVEYLYPNSTPAWMSLPTRKHQPTGRILRTAATSNTFMRAHIARADGLGLRFNEAMRFTGGSDNEYFFRAADRGARICWMDDAVVYENVPESRTTLQWHCDRSRRVAANSVFIHRHRLGLLGTIAKFGPKYAGRVLSGAILAPAAAMISFVAEQTGNRMMFSAQRNLSSGLGGLGAFLEFQPEPYRAIDNL